jgi:hypothetical protein
MSTNISFGGRVLWCFTQLKDPILVLISEGVHDFPPLALLVFRLAQATALLIDDWQPSYDNAGVLCMGHLDGVGSRPCHVLNTTKRVAQRQTRGVRER